MAATNQYSIWPLPIYHAFRIQKSYKTLWSLDSSYFILYFILYFIIHKHIVCLLMRDKKRVDPGERGGQKKLQGIGVETNLVIL